MSAAAAERTFAFWIPDWPVHALRLEQAASGEGSANPIHEGSAPAAPVAAPIALVSARRVVSCSEAARAGGVRTGMREREALAQCPELAVHAHDPEVDERRFAPVVAAIESISPGVDPLRPGLCALRGRGPTRYYGSEEAAASVLLAVAAELGFADARLGVADGVFAAQQAARTASTSHGVRAPAPGIRIVRSGGAAAFLSPLPVECAAESGLADLLQGLGIRTLGALAALPEGAVRQRFGVAGVAAHRRARAAAPAHGGEVRPRPPVRDLAAELAFEPPLETADQLAFACARLAERFIAALAEERLVCTALRVEITDDIGVRHERLWSHPRRFTPPDAVNRIRWQADGMPRDPERGGAGIAQVRIAPARTERAAAHEPALWSTEPDERVHHRFSQVQSRLGHTELGTMELVGGRLVAERQRLVPWGTQRRGRPAAGPWPGTVPGPQPSTVFSTPIAAELLCADGEPVGVDTDELLPTPPSTLRVGANARSEVLGWSAPWSLRERWWEGRPARLRLQVQLADGTAWLLLHDGDRWLAEGRYD